MKVALIADEYRTSYSRFEDYYLNYSAMGYVEGLSRALVEAGHEVLVIAHKPESEFNNGRFTALGLGMQSDIEFSQSVHHILCEKPVDVVEAPSFKYPLLIEQLVGGTPTVVRVDIGTMDLVEKGRWADDVKYASRHKSWSRHLLELKTVSMASGIIAPKSVHRSRASLITDAPISGISNGVDILIDREDLFENREGFIIPVLDVSREMSALVKGICSVLQGEKVTLVGHPNIGSLFDGAFLNTVTLEMDIGLHCWTKRLLSCEAVILPGMLSEYTPMVMDAMVHACPTICFNCGPDTASWPLYFMGEQNILSVRNLPKILDFMRKEKREDQVNKFYEFAEKHLWSKLIPEYEEIYLDAMAYSANRGRTRGW